MLGGLSEQRYSGWVKQDFRLSPRLRLELGLRGDVVRFGFTNRLRAVPGASALGSGDRWLGMVSPKASLAIDLAPGTTLFANGGASFHSNDARDVVTAPSGTLLPRAVGVELGVRRTWASGSVAASLWGLDLQSELVYVGDAGTTEARGRTRRSGVDLEGRARLVPSLWFDGDLTLSRGRFRDEPTGADRVPLAPTVTASGGLTLQDLGAAAGGFRIRHVGARAADETNTVRARGYTVAELFGSYGIGAVRVFGARTTCSTPSGTKRSSPPHLGSRASRNR